MHVIRRREVDPLLRRPTALDTAGGPLTPTKLHHDPAMSAPQIPNLNTLRRGGGRGRLRGRGGHDGSNSSSGKDRVVQGTDNDASVSRLSAVGLGYLDDPFAKALTPSGLETRRLPIINRGEIIHSSLRWFTTVCVGLIDGLVGQGHMYARRRLTNSWRDS